MLNFAILGLGLGLLRDWTRYPHTPMSQVAPDSAHGTHAGALGVVLNSRDRVVMLLSDVDCTLGVTCNHM